MAGKNQEEGPTCEKGAPRWLVTYSAMVTLLLCFFILLLSFADTKPPVENDTPENKAKNRRVSILYEVF